MIGILEQKTGTRDTSRNNKRSKKGLKRGNKTPQHQKKNTKKKITVNHRIDEIKRFLESDEPYGSMEFGGKNRSNVQFATEVETREDSGLNEYNNKSDMRGVKSNLKKGRSNNMILDQIEAGTPRNGFNNSKRNPFEKNGDVRNMKGKGRNQKNSNMRGQVMRAKSSNVRGSVSRNRGGKGWGRQSGKKEGVNYMNKLKRRTAGRKPHWGTSSTRRPGRKAYKSQVQSRARSQKKRDRTPQPPFGRIKERGGANRNSNYFEELERQREKDRMKGQRIGKFC